LHCSPSAAFLLSSASPASAAPAKRLRTVIVVDLQTGLRLPATFLQVLVTVVERPLGPRVVVVQVSRLGGLVLVQVSVEVTPFLALRLLVVLVHVLLVSPPAWAVRVQVVVETVVVPATVRLQFWVVVVVVMLPAVLVVVVVVQPRPWVVVEVLPPVEVLPVETSKDVETANSGVVPS